MAAFFDLQSCGCGHYHRCVDPACARAPAARQGDQSGEKKCVNLLRASAFVPWLLAFPPVVRAGVYSTGTDRTNSPLRVLLRALSHMTSRLFHPCRARLAGRHSLTPFVRPGTLGSSERPTEPPPRTVRCRRPTQAQQHGTA